MIEKRCPACNDILFRGRIERGVIELVCKRRDCPDRRKLVTYTFPEPESLTHHEMRLHVGIA